MGRRIGRGQRSPRGKGTRRDQSGLLRYPRSVLAIAATLLIALGAIGLGVEDRLDPTTLDVPGTESNRGNELLRQHFGETAPFAILLRGPAKALDRQGPELIRALRRDPRVTTLSPWDTGSVQRLRPDPRRALILADFHVDVRTAVNDSVPHLDEGVSNRIDASIINFFNQLCQVRPVFGARQNHFSASLSALSSQFSALSALKNRRFRRSSERGFRRSDGGEKRSCRGTSALIE